MWFLQNHTGNKLKYMVVPTTRNKHQQFSNIRQIFINNNIHSLLI